MEGENMEGIEQLIHQATDVLAPIETRQQAFGKIVSNFQNMAHGCAYTVLGDFHKAQDAAQEAFIEAWRSLDSLQEPKAFAGWLKRIVIRQCGRLTRRKALDTTPIEEALAVPSDQVDPYTEVERQEVKAIVHSAVKSLSEPERTATTLFYIDGYTQPEIANILEVPITTVNMRLHRARKHLKESLIQSEKGGTQNDLRHHRTVH